MDDFKNAVLFSFVLFLLIFVLPAVMAAVATLWKYLRDGDFDEHK